MMACLQFARLELWSADGLGGFLAGGPRPVTYGSSCGLFR
jgi:hypothetical protein